MINKILSIGVILATALIFMAISPKQQAEDYTRKWLIDTSHSEIGFTINHLFTPVRGKFTSYESEIYFDPETPEESQIEVIVDVKSITTGNEKRDTDLRSENFFDAKNYPEISFISDNIVGKGGNEFTAKGEITIRDITKPLNLNFTLLGIRDHYRVEGYIMAGIVGSVRLKRTDFNVGTGDWMRTNIVGDEVNIELALELASKKEGE